MDEVQLTQDIKAIFQKNTWRPELFLSLIDKYNVTPETLLKRLMNILPKNFGIEQLFFQRVTGSPDLKDFTMTQKLHLGELHHPYGNLLNEHYCHRWVAIKVLKKLRMEKALSPDTNLLVDAQISEYWESDSEYFCISLAKQDAQSSKESISVTIGFKLNNNLRSTVPFIHNPDLKRREVNITCERCSMPNCESRVAAPMVIEKEREQAAMKEELKNLVES